MLTSRLTISVELGEEESACSEPLLGVLLGVGPASEAAPALAARASTVLECLALGLVLGAGPRTSMGTGWHIPDFAAHCALLVGRVSARLADSHPLTVSVACIPSSCQELLTSIKVTFTATDLHCCEMF